MKNTVDNEVVLMNESIEKYKQQIEELRVKIKESESQNTSLNDSLNSHKKNIDELEENIFEIER